MYLLTPQKDAVVVTHLKGSEGVAACGAASQQVALATLKKPFLHGYQRERGEKCLLLTKMAGTDIHILRKQKLFHLADLPFQIFLSRGSNGNQQIQIVEVLVVGKTFLQKIAASDGAVDVIKISVGVARVLDFRTIDAELLAYPLEMRSLGCLEKNMSMSMPSPALTIKLSHPAGTCVL